jgi:hypothetical protein
MVIVVVQWTDANCNIVLDWLRVCLVCVARVDIDTKDIQNPRLDLVNVVEPRVTKVVVVAPSNTGMDIVSIHTRSSI